MKFRLMSDLHMEGVKYEPKEIDIGQDYTILAGDIHYTFNGMDIARSDWGIPAAKIIFTPGNHEFYKGMYHARLKAMRDYSSHYGIKAVFDGSEAHELDEDVVVLGGTLWTNFSYWYDRIGSIEETWRCLFDYSLIMDDNFIPITPSFTIGLFNECITNLQKNLDRYKDKKVVIVTHHAPSSGSVHPRWASSPITGGFVSLLEEFIKSNPQIRLWCHGHTHDPFDYMVGSCRVVANPRGYVRKGGMENPYYDENLILEV